MSNLKEKQAFSQRLNQLLDEHGVPPKGHGRQEYLGKMAGVSQKGARKWIEAEGFPTMSKAIFLANRLNVPIEWLLTGRGPARLIFDQGDKDLAEIIYTFKNASEHGRTFLMSATRVVSENYTNFTKTGTLDA